MLSGVVWGVGRVEAKSDREGGNEPRSLRSENKFGIVVSVHEGGSGE